MDKLLDWDTVNLDSALNDIFHHICIFTCPVLIDKKYAVWLDVTFYNHPRVSLVLLDDLTELFRR